MKKEVRHPRLSKTEEPTNRFKEKEAEANRQAALIDAEKYKRQAEEARKQKEKAELELKQEQSPQVHFPRKK